MIEGLAAWYAAHSKLVDQIGINALLALSLWVVLVAGQLALAQAAFMGIGAYLSAIVAVNAHWPFLPAALLGAAVSAIVGALLALPVGRLRGVFLAIATIGFGEIVRVIANNLTITGGAEGFSGIPSDANTWWIFGTLAVVLALVWAFRRSRFATAIVVTREDEAAARGVGVDTAQVRIGTLAIAGAIAGFAGALYAHTNYFIVPTDFAFGRVEQILVYCVIGGVTSPLGAIAGAAFLTVLPEFVRALGNYRDVINGLILLGVILFFPGGIASIWRRGARSEAL